jgi:protein TonB
MATKDPLYTFMPYGAPELREAAQRFQIRSLGLSSALAALLFVVLAVVQVVSPHAQRSPGAFFTHEVTVITDHPIEVETPPLVPRVAASRSIEPADPRSVPTIVPDVQAPPEALDQGGGGESGEESGAGSGSLDGVTGEPDLGSDGHGTAPDADDPTMFVYTDTPAVLAVEVVPEYPDIAKQAGVEGRVVMQVRVGTDGRVKDVRGTHIQIPMLNEAARTACWKLVFTPATVNGHPVAVWTSVPFEFELH